ncbi:MAG: DNA polymerase I [Chloroflexi bacterium]|nr:DNA polymerase I [Chloroflexota bacterium]
MRAPLSGIRVLELAGYEADDLMGTLARKAEAAGYDVVLVTGDKDLLQLVSDHIQAVLTRKGITQVDRYTPQAVLERFGVTPAQIIDLKGFMGDPSDNIPGVPGIGEKTAVKLLQQFPSVESVLEHLDEITGTKLRARLAEHREQALLSKRLATIRCDAPLPVDVPDLCLPAVPWPRVREAFQRLGFRSLLDRIPRAIDSAAAADDSTPTADDNAPYAVSKPALPSQAHSMAERGEQGPARSEAAVEVRADLPVERVYTRRAWSTLLAQLTGPIGILPVCDSLDYHQAHLLGVALGVRGRGWFLSLEPGRSELNMGDIRPLLTPEFEKVTFDLKALAVVLDGRGTALVHDGSWFDVMIGSYLLNPSDGEVSLAHVVERELRRTLPPVQPGQEDAPEAAARFAACLPELQPHIAAALQAQAVDDLYQRVELPLEFVLARMEVLGFPVDAARLRQFGVELQTKIEQLRTRIFEQAGSEFNLNSPKQLGEVLFDKLGLPALKKTKTGYSTSADVLEKLAPYHQVVHDILEYRQLTKLKTTYVDALPALVNPRTGRIHTSFNQTVARTGRLSSSEPNLQNIPVRTPLGRRIRQAFIASRPDSVLLSADYSQIELRILAHVTQDPALLAAFARGDDIHAATAAAIFRVSLEAVTPEQRRVAKTTNFGVIYGISDFGLAERTDLSRQEAAQFIRTYFETYPGIRDYIERTKEAARRGRVQTLTGRFQRFSEREILSATPSVRGAAERTAINMPIQGTAADIIKLAMVRLHRELTERGIQCGLLLQVHDELLLEVEERRVEEIARLVCDVMEHAYELSVPLKVEVKVGKNWDEMTALHV